MTRDAGLMPGFPGPGKLKAAAAVPALKARLIVFQV